MNKEVMFSSKTDQWATPQHFFDKLNKEFHFNLDPCADEVNHKCEKYYTSSDDGLLQNWGVTEFFAIHLMAEILANGSKRHIGKGTKIIHLCAY